LTAIWSKINSFNITTLRLFNMRKLILFILLFITFFFVECKKDDNEDIVNVQYRITFSFNWNNQDFSNDYPSNAHFSKLIGWSHKSTSTLFEVGTLATEGIENMAESGGTTPLDNEINDRIVSGEGLQLVIGNSLGSGTGDIIVDITIDKEYTSVTLATMIAPSPDWYVAVVNINLFENGEFVDNKTVNAIVYDAGTDDGTTFTSSDDDTDPQQPISIIVNPPLGNGSTVTPAIAIVNFSKQ